jgi:ribosomal protein S18 acetylase RimI-like enzyme
MRRDEGPVWADVQRDAEPYISIDPGLFEREFGSDPAAIERRCFLLVNERDVAVGTISGWYALDFKGAPAGRLHWLAVRPACQGRGLGRAAVSFVLHRMAERHDRCFLITSAARLHAVKLYLDFGFRPDLERPGAVEAWESVREQLDHPVLREILP